MANAPHPPGTRGASVLGHTPIQDPLRQGHMTGGATWTMDAEVWWQPPGYEYPILMDLVP